MEGFLQALDEFRLTSPEQRRHYESTPYIEEEGAAVVRRLLDEGQKFDALIVHGDWATLGAVTELRGHGLEVPRDVALLMYDDYYAVQRMLRAFGYRHAAAVRGADPACAAHPDEPAGPPEPAADDSADPAVADDPGNHLDKSTNFRRTL